MDTSVHDEHLTIMLALQKATLAARKRTGDNLIGTCGERGLLKLVRVLPAKKGLCEVIDLSGWLTWQDAVAALDAM